MNPLVSIIIPTYNRAHLIGETLDSILAQTYTNWECIVVDDGSTDGTNTLLNSYCENDARFQYHHRPEKHLPGGNGARNYGFLLSKGEYVQWFDDDDVMLNVFVEEKINVFTQELCMVICSGYYWNPDINLKENIDLSIKTSLYEDYILWKLKILIPSILFKRQYFSDGQLFNEKILRGQEAELFSRLFFQLPEYSFKLINKSLFLYRQHIETKSIIGKKYVPSFKESRFIFLVNNFNRCQILNNKKIRQSQYRSMLKLFFDALNNNHKKLAFVIIDDFFQLLKKESYWKTMELVIVGKILIFYSYPRSKFYNRWKYFMFNK